jgi:hypothetical protein
MSKKTRTILFVILVAGTCVPAILWWWYKAIGDQDGQLTCLIWLSIFIVTMNVINFFSPAEDKPK